MNRGRHLSYANVIATLALFVALGGSSYAALTITGKQIRNNTVRSTDIRNGTLQARDVRVDALGGSSIIESSLARVPDADMLDGLDSSAFERAGAKAADADRVDGFDSSAFERAGAKAADADRVDGLDSTELQRGSGQTVAGRRDWNTSTGSASAQAVLDLPGIGMVIGTCVGYTNNQRSHMRFENDNAATVFSWMSSGSGPDAYAELAPAAAQSAPALSSPSPAALLATWQVRAGERTATVVASTRFTTSASGVRCQFQAQAFTS
jgi:hypothetical protein